MAGLTLKLAAQKILGQIRYRPTLLSLDATKIAAKELEEKYLDWEVAESADITLSRSDQNTLFSFRHDSVTYINESREDFDELTRHLKVAFEKHILPANISEVRHIGIRNVLIFSTNFQFDELAEYLHELFYKEGVSSKISAEKISDMMFAVDGGINKFMNHVRIGPVRGDEGKKFFNSAFPKRELLLTGEAFLFMDIDVYAKGEENNPKKSMEQISAAIIENKRIASAYLELIRS